MFGLIFKQILAIIVAQDLVGEHYANISQISRSRCTLSIGGMELVARLVVEGFVTGLHKSPYQGFSVEFAEHRQYMPGDEIRYIDWKVYGNLIGITLKNLKRRQISAHISSSIQVRR